MWPKMEKANMDSKQMLMIIEQFSRKEDPDDDDIQVTQIADQKTVFVEQSGESGRVIMMSEYTVDGKKYWAGYSSRSQMVYISQTA